MRDAAGTSAVGSGQVGARGQTAGGGAAAVADGVYRALVRRDNGIVHWLTEPRSPTTTGKVERFHQSLRRELLDDAVPFADLQEAQAAGMGG